MCVYMRCGAVRCGAGRRPAVLIPAVVDRTVGEQCTRRPRRIMLDPTRATQLSEFMYKSNIDRATAALPLNLPTYVLAFARTHANIALMKLLV